MIIVVVDATELGAAELGEALQAASSSPLSLTLTHTTEAALYALDQVRPECLVVGVQDGPTELLHTLRAGLNGRLPCATLALGRTGHDLAAAAAFRAGAHDYARRDAQPELLWQTVENCVDRFAETQGESERREMLEYFLSNLEAKSALKSRFVANASHELRTPISSMVGLVGLLEPHVAGEEGHALLATMNACCEGMLVVVDDLLDLTGLESGQIELRQETFSLGALVGRVAASWQTVARDKGVTLNVKTADALPTLVGDPRRLRQVLFNTLGGALKFAQSAVDLEVSSSTAGELVEVTVQVRVGGAELTESERRTLLDPFPDQARAGNDYANLGLAVATTLARAVQGSFVCDAVPDYGVLFTFSFSSPWAESEPGVVALESSPPSGSVLVAEDNPIVANIISLQLRGMGFQVTVVGDGVAAVEQARAHPFAAIIMDCQMPRKDGLQATRELRELYSPQQLPIVALTASGQVGQAEQCLAVGMNDFLIKPATAEQLKAVLARHTRV